MKVVKVSVEVCMNFMSLASFQAQQKQSLIRKNYAEIYAHEAAHKRAGGSLAGAIVIEKNSEGIPVGGHVSIKMPKLNKENPEQTIEQANVVFKSALAPSDPSEQDYKVAKQAKSLISQAERLKSKKKLDYYA